MVGLVLSLMLVAVTGSLCLVGSRTFVATGSYAELDAKSRNGIELRTRHLRSAPRVAGIQNNDSTQSLRVTHAVAGTQLACKGNATPRTLVCQETGQRD